MEEIQKNPQSNAIMVINTDDLMTVGEMTYGFITTPDGEQVISIKCLGEASLEEYISFVKEHHLEHMINRSIHDKHLYFVEVLD